MRVGIIGCGSIGSRHARNLVSLGHIVALFDAEKACVDALARDCGTSVITPGTSDWCALEADAMLICTPTHTHASVAQTVFYSGYTGPLFVEKALASSPEECDVFRKWPHPTTMVGYMLRWTDEAIDLKYRRLDDPDDTLGASGAFLQMLCNSRLWPGSAASGAMLLECSHELDLALWLGAPNVVESAAVEQDSARIWLGRGDGTDSWNGCGWQIHLDWRASVDRRVWTFDHESVTPSDLDGAYKRELAHFLECAQRGVPTITPFADGIRVLDVIQQAERLAATRV